MCLIINLIAENYLNIIGEVLTELVTVTGPQSGWEMFLFVN